MFSIIPKTTFRFSFISRSSRSIHSTSSVLNSQKNKDAHSADSYFKDVDTTPPQNPTTHRVDAASEAAQRPYEPPSGQWSQAGAQTKEYSTVNEEKPYDSPSDGDGAELRYGGKEKYSQEKGSETSHSGEGPAGTERGGRKPEGR